MMIKRFLSMTMACLALCVGSFAFASDMPQTYAIRYAVADVGAHGAAMAKFEAVLAVNGERTSQPSHLSSGLRSDSHGFVQASTDEVAKGTMGSTTGLTAV